MSSGFSWSQIVGGKENATEQTENTTQSTPSVPPTADEASPFTVPGLSAEAGVPQDESELKDVLSKLRAGNEAFPDMEVPAIQTPRFEDIAPGMENTFDTTIDGGVPLSRPLSGQVAPEPSVEQAFGQAEPEVPTVDSTFSAEDFFKEVAEASNTPVATPHYDEKAIEEASFTSDSSTEVTPTVELETPATVVETPALETTETEATFEAPAGFEENLTSNELESTGESEFAHMGASVSTAESEINSAPPVMSAPPIAAEPPVASAPPVPEPVFEEPEATAPAEEDPLAKIFGKAIAAKEKEKAREDAEDAKKAPMSFDDRSTSAMTDQEPEKRDFGRVRKAAESLKPVNDIHIDEVLKFAVERKASDIHLTVGLPPMARIDGEIVPLPYQPLTAADTRRMVYEVINDDKLEKFERTHELDFAYAVRDVGRFRFNLYMQRGAVTAAMRAIPTKIPDFEALGLPPIIREMAKRSSGLILVTGPTGSGKSTTIATMIDDINNSRKSHIITIEDPIEYLHMHKQCMVNQREMHADTYSFHAALRAVLREDPDIILVGELRDLETIEAALTLAETGHLVFGTLHTRNAPSTVDRIIDVFPTDAQAQIKVLLSNTLEGVVSQQLLPTIGGGRCASIEVMVATPAIKNLVREGKTHQMYSIIETSSQHGMQTMDAMLGELYRSGRCDWDECMMRSIDKETFSRLAKGG